MAVGLSTAEANAALDALTASPWVKLHLGDPGNAGTANAATETTRKQVTFAAASGAARTTTGAAEWTSYPAAETVSHISYWTASSGGTFLGSAALTASKTMAIGETLRIPTGDLDRTLGPLAA
jgi:hypothetical protein